ncbi:hypothetical protein D3C71_1405210 [compost metagenome]
MVLGLYAPACHSLPSERPPQTWTVWSMVLEIRSALGMDLPSLVKPLTTFW